MCTEYLITTIVAGKTTTTSEFDTCPDLPPSGNVKECPKYALKPAGSSRRKAGPLPDWTTKK
ncbi:hypothetical protein N7508_007398 [Penicillium antarcticum]|uniref:uncharacterized protein n=1 Tax=Penicillium antarcticum TaxID=416450 RepID=UPI002389037C|nr:uncharacterized protein N7508_007398 [Penicillium antarcticum]KAJ5300155.1 hypothetical protein N7508_007398 [Penicillium antarcticum]KAJ6070563.1 hypothetical protein N7467_011882 [Penicillium canescens]